MANVDLDLSGGSRSTFDTHTVHNVDLDRHAARGARPSRAAAG
jgi:hypothetical protein